MAQPQRPVIGVFQSQMPGDLLRAPPLGQQLGDQLTKVGVFVDPTPVTADSALNRPAMRFERPVLAIAATVAA
ncbi:hypothetical protein BHF99_11610 [Corynebacterium diphtheriae]|nr:hypothetical protein BHF99_11610 [Corynebacterium diphtheriae]